MFSAMQRGLCNNLLSLETGRSQNFQRNVAWSTIKAAVTKNREDLTDLTVMPVNKWQISKIAYSYS